MGQKCRFLVVEIGDFGAKTGILRFRKGNFGQKWGFLRVKSGNLGQKRGFFCIGTQNGRISAQNEGLQTHLVGDPSLADPFASFAAAAEATHFWGEKRPKRSELSPKWGWVGGGGWD